MNEIKIERTKKRIRTRSLGKIQADWYSINDERLYKWYKSRKEQSRTHEPDPWVKSRLTDNIVDTNIRTPQASSENWSIPMVYW